MSVNPSEVASQIVAALETAYNSGDAKAYASLFTEDADFLNRFGMHFEGRQAIENIHVDLFGRLAKGNYGELKLMKARTLTDDVIYAKADGEWHVPPGSPMSGTTLSRYSIIIVRSGNEWQVGAMQNTGPSERP